MAEQPIDTQVREFWFKFGLRCDNVGWYVPINEVDAVPDYYIGGLSTPDLDLNNLFKYAVPKLGELRLRMLGQTKKRMFYCSVGGNILSHSYVEDKDPALALFWALWQVRGVNNSKEEKH